MPSHPGGHFAFWRASPPVPTGLQDLACKAAKARAMASDSLLSALQSNYGAGNQVSDDVSTVRGLLAYCKKWTQGLVRAHRLNNPCMEMVTRLREAAVKMESDLAESPDMTESMRGPITRMMEAYRAISDALEELPEFAMEDNMKDFKDNLEVFEEEREAVLVAQEQLNAQLSGGLALCPKCGSSGEEVVCPTCQLTRLYPDPGALADTGSEAEQVQGIYGKVYRAYRRVLSGERSLSVLWNALELLHEHLDELVDTRKELSRKLEAGILSGTRLAEAQLVESVLKETEPDVLLAMQGAERMREAEESRRGLDLSRGWEDIYQAAQAIELRSLRIRRQYEDDDTVS